LPVWRAPVRTVMVRLASGARRRRSTRRGWRGIAPNISAMLQIIKELLHEQRDRRRLRRDAGKDERAAAGQGAPDPSGGGRQRPPEPAPAPPLIQAGAAVPYTGYPAPSFGPGTRQGASAGLPPNAPLNPPGYPQIPPRTPIRSGLRGARHRYAWPGERRRVAGPPSRAALRAYPRARRSRRRTESARRGAPTRETGDSWSPPR